jgi:hypothetical protein
MTTNIQFAITDEAFHTAVNKTNEYLKSKKIKKIGYTARQASKFRRGIGVAYRYAILHQEVF